jgi:hypothetical protein
MLKFQISNFKFQISRKIGLPFPVDESLSPYAAIAFAKVVDPRADGSKDQQPAEEADGGLPWMLAEVCAPSRQTLAGVLAEFPGAVRQGVASGVGEK